MKKVLVLGAVLSVSLLSGILTAATGEEAVEKFKSRFYSIQTMKGVISVTYSSGESMVGAFKYMAPGKFYIKFTAPAGKEISTNGKRLWIYDKGNNVCGIQDVGANYSGGIAGFIKNYMALASSSGSDTMIRLKSPSQYYRDITVMVDSGYMVKKVTFRTEKGDGFAATFSNVVLNESIPAGAFDFNVPTSAQVVRNPLDVR
jgi:outer membrane lipoprotein-sorting protein